ncbi:hypothetical protein [Xanthomonas theicola]|uniref:hypothetical protein n=1 Tax=Xanthomonas theicola TaxID=56464 RepID=UPI0026A53CD5
MAQEWLAEVRRGALRAAKIAARKAPTMKEYCHIFMKDQRPPYLEWLTKLWKKS